jgi:hypothetical protein
MYTEIILLVFCAVVTIASDNGLRPDYVRVKRAKYYSSPPMRYYRKPPAPFPVKGYFSYTPPPNYMDSEDSPYPGSFRPNKVSKSPTDGLADEDISSLVTNLSEKDFDRLMEYSKRKYKKIYDYNDVTNIDDTIPKQYQLSYDAEKNVPKGQYTKDTKEYNVAYTEKVNKIENKPEDSNYRGPYAPSFSINNPIYVEEKPYYASPSKTPNNTPQDLSDVQLNTEESMKRNQFSFLNAYIEQDLNNRPPVVSDNEATEEEKLPKPINLREDDDYTASSTNNAPKIVKSHSYKVENFGDLPLMDYHSKLHTVSSYHVPHYSVSKQVHAYHLITKWVATVS